MIIWNRKCKGPRCFDSREQGERGGEGVREYFIHEIYRRIVWRKWNGCFTGSL